MDRRQVLTSISERRRQDYGRGAEGDTVLARSWQVGLEGLLTEKSWLEKEEQGEGHWGATCGLPCPSSLPPALTRAPHPHTHTHTPWRRAVK